MKDLTPGERGLVVKERNPFSIERYGAPSPPGKGSGVRSSVTVPLPYIGKGLGVRSEVQLARLYYER